MKKKTLFFVCNILLILNGTGQKIYFSDYKENESETFTFLDYAYKKVLLSPKLATCFYNDYSMPMLQEEIKDIVNFKGEKHASFRFHFQSDFDLNGLLFLGFTRNYYLENMIEPIIEIPLSEYKNILSQTEYNRLLQEIKKLIPSILSDTLVKINNGNNLGLLRYDYTKERVIFNTYGVFSSFHGSFDNMRLFFPFELYYNDSYNFYSSPLEDSIINKFSSLKSIFYDFETARVIPDSLHQDLYNNKISLNSLQNMNLNETIIQTQKDLTGVYFTNNIEIIETKTLFSDGLESYSSELKLSLITDFIGIRNNLPSNNRSKESIVWMKYSDFLDSIKDPTIKKGVEYIRYSRLQSIVIP